MVIRRSERRRDLIEYKPERILTEFERMFDEFRRDLWHTFWEPLWPFERAREMTPAVDMIDRGDRYVVRMGIPGFSKDQIDVEITSEGLTVSADLANEREEEAENYICREISRRSFRRYLEFPEKVLEEKAEATMKDGMLEIIVPKAQPKPKRRGKRLKIK